MVCEVIVNRDSAEVDQVYDYSIPTEYEDYLKVGSRVLVNFNNSYVVAFVVKIKESSNFKLKPIIDLIDINPILDEFDLKLVDYFKNRYFVSTIKAINTIIPTIASIKYQTKIKVLNYELLNDKLKPYFAKGKTISLTKELKKKLHIIKQEELNGNIEIINSIVSQKISQNEFIIHVKDIKTKSEKQNRLLNYLRDKLDYISRDKLKELGFDSTTINTLLKKGAIAIKKEDRYIDPEVLKSEKKDITLTSEQVKAINNIDLNKYMTYLLHGVTGSGKTMVYIELIKKVIANNKKCLVLVPEISLTPQLAAIFKSYFGDNIAIFHSALTNQERISQYLKVKENKVQVVLGARSAIFMPLKELGLIVIDEEQEQSYKQDNVPCYDARDLAIFIANMHNIPLVLGSATPRVVTYYKAINGEYKLLELTKRATNLKLPKMSVVNMKAELADGNHSPISNELKAKIDECLSKGEQAILFLNRRGFATSVMCRDCGHIIKCPNCDAPLTYHVNRANLICHLCDYKEPIKHICPKCGSKRIKYVGLGTETIASKVSELFPKARVFRVDSDSVGRDYNSFYQKILKHEVDIVVGTQMLAKGLDFTDVTLVGVLNADIGFFYPTYDANEVNYNILTQVAGRAGRHKEGEVVIQTYNPQNDVISAVVANNYQTFYNSEIKRRDMLNNPPFSILYQITISNEDINVLNTISNEIADTLINLGLDILGPSEAINFKVKNVYNYNIYIKAKEILNLKEQLAKYQSYIKIIEL